MLHHLNENRVVKCNIHLYNCFAIIPLKIQVLMKVFLSVVYIGISRKFKIFLNQLKYAKYDNTDQRNSLLK